MFDATAYHKEYREKRKEDPERRAKHNKVVSESIMRKYHNNDEWREEYNRKRRERYAMKKALNQN